VKRFGKYRRKVSWIVKREGKYGREPSWIVKRYGKCGRKVGNVWNAKLLAFLVHEWRCKTFNFPVLFFSTFSNHNVWNATRIVKKYGNYGRKIS
jgi:hypothetical protein